MPSNSALIKKLQRAINAQGYKLLYSTSQFYSEQEDRPITVYVLKKSIWDEEKQKTRSLELFKFTSQIQIVLYLRDLWYEINGWEVPTDNEQWTKIKEKYMEKESLNGQ